MTDQGDQNDLLFCTCTTHIRCPPPFTETFYTSCIFSPGYQRRITFDGDDLHCHPFGKVGSELSELSASNPPRLAADTVFTA